MEEIYHRGRTKVDMKSRMWQRVISTTHQPRLSAVSPYKKDSTVTSAMEDVSITAKEQMVRITAPADGEPAIEEPYEDEQVKATS